jgi:uncharacterized protein
LKGFFVGWVHGERVMPARKFTPPVNQTIFFLKFEKNSPMLKSTKAQVDAFLAQKDVAVAGYSRDPKKFGHMLYKTLKEKGYQVYPVNPAGGEAPGGEPIYSAVPELPEHVRALVVVTKPEVSPQVVREALNRGVDHLWIQQMSDGKVLQKELSEVSANVIFGRCILMHAHPTGIHKFHRWLAGVFGRLPK